MIYLSLVRFKIDFVYSNFSSNNTPFPNGSVLLLYLRNFLQQMHILPQQRFPLLWYLRFMLIPLLSLLVGWRLRKYYFDFDLRGVFVVVVVHSIRSLFHIHFTRVQINSLPYFPILGKCYREKMLEFYVHTCTVTRYTVLSNLREMLQRREMLKRNVNASRL